MYIHTRARFWKWEETDEPKGNPHGYWKNMWNFTHSVKLRIELWTPELWGGNTNHYTEKQVYVKNQQCSNKSIHLLKQHSFSWRMQVVPELTVSVGSQLAPATLQQFAFSFSESHAGIRNEKTQQTLTLSANASCACDLALALFSRCFWGTRLLNVIIRPSCFSLELFRRRTSNLYYSVTGAG